MKEIIKNNKMIEKCVLIILEIVIVISFIFMGISLYNEKKNIEQSISEEFILQNDIKEAIIKERNRVKREEYTKIILKNSVIIIISVIGIIIINKRRKNENK